MSIKREFIPYEQALALKELGFDEPCFAIYYNKTREFVLGKIVNEYTLEVRTWAPLYQQAFRWLYQKLNIEKDTMPLYTESQQLLLKELISIIKESKDGNN